MVLDEILLPKSYQSELEYPKTMFFHLLYDRVINDSDIQESLSPRLTDEQTCFSDIYGYTKNLLGNDQWFSMASWPFLTSNPSDYAVKLFLFPLGSSEHNFISAFSPVAPVPPRDPLSKGASGIMPLLNERASSDINMVFHGIIIAIVSEIHLFLQPAKLRW